MIVVAGGVPVGVLLLLGKGRIGEVATTRTTKKVPVVGWGVRREETRNLGAVGCCCKVQNTNERQNTKEVPLSELEEI